MSARAVAWEVPEAHDGNALRVRAVRRSSIEVRWPCGDTREFTHEDALTVVDTLDVLAGRPVWFAGHDSTGSPFAVQVADGWLYGYEEVPSDSDEPHADRMRFRWMSLRELLIELCAKRGALNG